MSRGLRPRAVPSSKGAIRCVNWRLALISARFLLEPGGCVGKISDMTGDDPNPEHFVAAQTDWPRSPKSAAAQGAAIGMSIISPQIDGLGSLAMTRRYAIGSLVEARAYLAHPALGPSLRVCVAAPQGLPGSNAEAVFGAVDGPKLCSSLTLFDAAGARARFEAAPTRWCGVAVPSTLLELG